MKINVPKSAYPITRIAVTTPKGVIRGDFSQGQKMFDVELPEGVTEEECSVTAYFLSNGQHVIDSAVLQEAKPADPPADEDCECGEGEACSDCDPEDEIALSDE